MTTSNSYNFTLNRNQIIREALEDAQLLGEEQVIENAMQQKAERKLNIMLKAWQSQGIHLWTTQEGTIFLEEDTKRYSLGSSGDHATDNANFTTLSADEALGQTVLSTTDTSDISVNDVIGIVLDDNTIHWSTVSSKTSTTVTIALALVSAASSGNRVYSYTNNLSTRPLKIIKAWVRDLNNTDIMCEVVSREEYQSLPNKDTSSNRVIDVYYDPGRESLGTLYVWPPANDVNMTLHIDYRRSIQDVDNSTDTLDLPVEGLEAIIAGLACAMCHKGSAQYPGLERDAGIKLQKFLDADHESTPLYIIPAIRR